MRVLALDHGTARIGAAVSDPSGIIAQPLDAIACKPGPRAVLEEIARRALEYEVEQIVIGLPLHMDGRAGEAAAAARAFGAKVAQRTGLPVEYLDERWTTLEAERTMREMGVKRSRQSGQLDATAAALLLRTYLERRREAPESSL